MAFLFARCRDGSICHFEKAELAFFFSDSSGKPYRHGGRLFAKYDIIVFGGLQWFKGSVDVHDFANDSPGENAVDSIIFPTAPHAKLELPAPPSREPTSSANPFPKPCPTLGTAEASFYIFMPTGLFLEIVEVDALNWLYQHLGHVPRRAQAAIEKVSRATSTSESGEFPNHGHGLDLKVAESKRETSPPDALAEPPKKPRITKEKIALYRKIVAAGHAMTHGQKGKRIDLGDKFKEDIDELEPGIEPVTFVKRAIAYCLKHPTRVKRR